MHEDVIACADLVRRGDPDRFRAVMAAPVAAREVLFPVYAFNLEVSRAPWVTEEPMIAEMRLQWWRDALGEIRDGGPVRRHEVATPLSGVVDAKGTELLDQLVAARRWDVYREPFEDMAHFREYIGKTSSNLLLAAARSLADVPEDTVQDTVREAGYALGLANWLRAVPALEKAGRIPLVEGTHQAIRALAEEGLDHLASARAARRTVPGAARPAMLVVWEAGPVLKAARDRPGRVGDGTLDTAPFRSRLTLMARAATGLW